FMGWEVDDQRELAAFIEQLRGANVEVTECTAEMAASRRVAGLARFKDPNGIDCEVYYGAHVSFEDPFHSPRNLSGFITGDQGIGHIVLAVDDLQDSLVFYRDVLGMRESDFINFERGGMSLELAFLHCNPRHHTVALAAIKRPKRLMHLMVQVEELDDVGSTYNLCSDREVPIAATMGRHTNDHMVSFYMNSPSGFEIEYGWGARVVDDATWKVQTHEAPSIWGHRRG
ncbi:MAG: 2,3-dihydroxybiphenyl 1,2-dioxygenase, partial [Chromatiales bacterium]|nr:2,3-dihydroxybiphenyl 1,2-dioxygenase [Chromatiales bacterium]